MIYVKLFAWFKVQLLNPIQDYNPDSKVLPVGYRRQNV